MFKTTTLVLSFTFLVLAAFTSNLQAQRKSGTLDQRDPELHQWVETLVQNLQKDHRAIRNSAAQALISVGADAAPYLSQLRESGDRNTRNLATRILERISRESGKNLFQDDVGGAPAITVAEQCANVLKLDEEKKELLTNTITLAQDQERKIRADLKEKTIDGEEAARLRKNLMQGTKLELQNYLDEKGVEYVVVRLGWGGKRTLGDEGEVIEPKDDRRRPDGERRADGDRRQDGERRGQGEGRRPQDGRRRNPDEKR